MSQYESYNESTTMSQMRKESGRMSQTVQWTGEADTLRQVASCISKARKEKEVEI